MSVALLKAKSIFPNKYRVEMYDFLHGAMHHPDAEKVFSHMKKVFPLISFATVYNNLNLFLQNGLLEVIVTKDRINHFDANVHAHDHFICEECQGIFDIPKGGKVVHSVEGHLVKQSKTTFLGQCQECHSKAS